MLPDINFEVQQDDSGDIAFLRGSVGETLARTPVQCRGDAGAVMLSEMFHGVALREVLTHQAIGVLVRPALPGVMGCGEVEASGGRALDGAVAMELGAIIHGDGVDGARLSAEEVSDTSVDLRGGAAQQLPECDIAVLRSTRLNTQAPAWLAPSIVSPSQCPT